LTEQLETERLEAERAARDEETVEGAPALDLPDVLPPDQSLGYLLRDTYKYLWRLMLLRLEPHGIRTLHWYVLRHLWREDGLTPSALSLRLGITLPSMTATLKQLEAKGLVERRRSADDRRRSHVFLTLRGRQLEARLVPFAAEVNAIAAADLPPEAIAQTKATLRQMRDNLAHRFGVERED